MIGDSIYRSSRKPRPLCISSVEGRGLIARDRERIYAPAYIRTRRVAGSQGERGNRRDRRGWRDNRRVMTREEEGENREKEKYSLYCTPHEGLEEAQEEGRKINAELYCFRAAGVCVKTMTLESEREESKHSRRRELDLQDVIHETRARHEDSTRKTQSHRAAMHCRSVLPFPGAAAHTVRVACGPRVYASGAL